MLQSSLYLNAEIKRLTAKVTSLNDRYIRLGIEIDRLKTEVCGVCFGSRKLLKKRDTVYTDTDVWKSVWQKRRSHGMTLSGRSDATGGNFLVRYDPVSHVLSYCSQSGEKVCMIAEFPHGQDLVDQAVIAGKEDRHSVAWRFERTHGSILVKCTIALDESGMNDCCLTGCVGFDTNVDNIAFSETDKYGNLLHHETIHFNLEGKSSGERNQILSNALEKVYQYAERVKKPVAGEDLNIKLKNLTYGSAIRNRILTGFAFRQVQTLAVSKSYKYGIAFIPVNPRYTSQAGKIKYARKFGLSIHESASFVIARRGMGLKEQLPAPIRKLVPPEILSLPRDLQWRKIYPIIKNITVKDVYKLIC